MSYNRLIRERRSTNLKKKINEKIFEQIQITKLLPSYLQDDYNKLLINYTSKGNLLEKNAKVVLDIHEHCMEHETDDILLFIDFEKAFDSVE